MALRHVETGKGLPQTTPSKLETNHSLNSQFAVALRFFLKGLFQYVEKYDDSLSC